MIRLFKLCVAMAAFVAFAWFGTTIKLGPRTLFQHLRAIGETQESRDLVDGTRQAAEPLVDGVRRRFAGGTPAQPATGPAAPGAPGAGETPAPIAGGPGTGTGAGAPHQASHEGSHERISDADKRQLRKLLADHR